VDDGSTDQTLRIARDFVADDRRFRLIRKANSGVADARNVGIAAASARLIAPLDADDVWHPTFLERMSAALEETGPAAAFAYANFRTIDAQGNVLVTLPAFDVAGSIVHQLVLHNFVGNGSGMMFWKSHAESVGGYDRRLQHQMRAQGCEDWLLQLRLAQRGKVIAVNAYLVGYRTVPGAMSSNRVRMLCSRLASLDLFAEDMQGVDYRVLRWARAAALLHLAWARLKPSAPAERRFRAAAADGMRALRAAPAAAIMTAANLAANKLTGASRRAAQRRDRPFATHGPEEAKQPWTLQKGGWALRRAAELDAAI
jgi:hypothetical protein